MKTNAIFRLINCISALPVFVGLFFSSQTAAQLRNESMARRGSPFIRGDYDSARWENAYTEYEYGRNPGFSYIKTWKSGKVGVCDTSWNVILPTSYLYIDGHFADGYCPNSDFLFDIQQEYFHFGLADKTGRVLAQPVYDRIGGYYIQQDSCGSSRPLYLIVQDKMETKKPAMWVVNPRTGQRSASYPMIHPFEQAFTFETKKGWGVLDTNFNEVLSGRSGFPMYFSQGVAHRGIKPVPAYSYSSFVFDDETRDHKWIDKDVLLCEMDEDELGEVKLELVNIRTGKVSKERYHSVILKTAGGENYFWCARYDVYPTELKGWTTCRTDILDANLKVIRTIYSDIKTAYEGIKYDQYLDEFFRSHPASLTVLRQTGTKIGALNPKGETIIPFEYDEVRCIPSGDMWEPKMTYELKKGTVVFRFDEAGKPMK